MSNLVDKLKKIRLQLLEELFENSYYDDASYSTFEKSVEAFLDKSKDQEISMKELCFELATVRNRNLITSKEQQKLRSITLAFFGLSVGSHSALAWMMESRADAIKIVDFDTLSASNLNRLRFGWEDIGKAKADVVEKYLRSINPFAKIITETKIDPESFIKIFDDEPKIQVVVDAIDSMRGKLLLRKLARERKLPLVSAADVGDNVMLDIERYDLSPQPSLFLGRVPNIEKIDFENLSAVERKKLIIKLIGYDHLSERLLDSLIGIGDNLSTWPQLGGTATMAGGVVTNTIKKIVLGEKVKSGRYYVSLDDLLVAGYDSNKRQRLRKRKFAEMKEKLYLK